MTESPNHHEEPRAPTDRLIFGICPSGAVTEKWPCAYAVVFNEYNRVAVIRAPNGNTLPGGGCDLGESPSNAVVRETLHEAGLPIEVIADLGAADQYVCISEASGWVLEQSSFFLTQRNGAVRRPFVPDHTLIWLDPPAAIGRLHRESHVWAVERAMALRAERRT